MSGSKGCDESPGFDAMLKAAVRHEFVIIAVWSSDRLGRSMSHLIEGLETIKSTGVGLYIHTQALDTTTLGGRAMFQMLGVFAEFEREMIKERVKQRHEPSSQQNRAQGPLYDQDGNSHQALWPSGQRAAQGRAR